MYSEKEAAFLCTRKIHYYFQVTYVNSFFRGASTPVTDGRTDFPYTRCSGKAAVGLAGDSCELACTGTNRNLN